VFATSFTDLEGKIAGGGALTRAEAERLLTAPDLISVGVLGEQARKVRSGDRVSYGRVAIVPPGKSPEVGEAGEVRLSGRVLSLDDGLTRVREAVKLAGDLPLTGFSLADLLEIAGSDHLALAEIARALRAEGLEAVAEAPLDRLGDTENMIEVVRAVRHGGLGVWRATVDRAPTAADRLELIERALAVQRETSALRALAPLPRMDPPDAPSTGYDDVRTIAAARAMCDSIPLIQVDWLIYGPKLAQVAIAYGADDIDAVPAVETVALGHRRSPREDIERQIRAAVATPVERDGRFGARA